MLIFHSRAGPKVTGTAWREQTLKFLIGRAGFSCLIQFISLIRSFYSTMDAPAESYALRGSRRVTGESRSSGTGREE